MERWLAIIYMVVAATTIAVQSATVTRPSIEEAEERLRELSKLLGHIKSSIQPRDCSDLLHAGQRRTGVYTVFHKSAGPLGQRVYCDMDTDGGGWTVIQRRGQFGNGVYHFYRNWTEYANGFGDPSEEYWIGNHALHALTSVNEEMAFRVVLSNNTEDSVSIDYESIRVDNEESFFKLHVGKHLGPEGWDAIKGHANGFNFSTYDRDNDSGPANCAEAYRGAWWYSQCHAANLNGLNLNGLHDSYADGIEWSVRRGAVQLYHYSFPEVRMMVRPAASFLNIRIKLPPRPAL